MDTDYKQKGVTQLYCMKCGKEISEKQVFCDSCLEVMERFPVKPDTRILLPNRTVPAAAKKSPARKKVLPLDERFAKAKKAIQWLSLALVISIIALCLSITLLADTIGAEKSNHAIGQNYSTVDAGKEAN